MRGWIKLHRQLLDHDWLLERPEHFMAWHILLLSASHDDAGYGRGCADLRAVYRKVRHTMDGRAWRRFVSRLEAEDMIRIRQSDNLGGRQGVQRVAHICRFDAYQGGAGDQAGERKTMHDMQKRRAKCRASAAQSAAQRSVQDENTEGERRAERRVYAEQSAADIKKDTSSLRSEVSIDLRREEAARAQQVLERSAEHAFFQVSSGRPNLHAERARVRGTLRRLAGPKFAERFENHLDTWIRHDDLALERLWTASSLEHWPVEADAGKRRSFIFEDLLNEDRVPVRPPTPEPSPKTHALHEAIEAAMKGDVERVDELFN